MAATESANYFQLSLSEPGGTCTKRFVKSVDGEDVGGLLWRNITFQNVMVGNRLLTSCKHHVNSRHEIIDSETHRHFPTCLCIIINLDFYFYFFFDLPVDIFLKIFRKPENKKEVAL
jgi:hypothetical protein